MALGYVQDRSSALCQLPGPETKLPGIARATRALGSLPCRHERALSSALTLQECAKAPNGSDLRTPNSVQHCPPSDTQLTQLFQYGCLMLSPRMRCSSTYFDNAPRNQTVIRMADSWWKSLKSISTWMPTSRELLTERWSERIQLCRRLCKTSSPPLSE